MLKRRQVRALVILVGLFLVSTLLAGCCYCCSGRRYRPFTWPRSRAGELVPRAP